jgi:ubiquinone/menaquinone biosynthesis C-methylase UbiE
MLPRAAGAREVLDRPVPAAARAASLRDIDRLNAWFGGYRLTLDAVARVVAPLPVATPLTIADVGGGQGDLAVRLVEWARRGGRRVRVLVVDRDPDLLAIAAARRARWPEIVPVRADADALPLADGAIDVAVMALTLHHLEPDAAARALAGMRAAARRGLVVNDLLRSRLSLLLVGLATRLVARHPISRHDGPLSVRRAYLPGELAVLAEKAGIEPLRVARYPALGRLVAVAP